MDILLFVTLFVCGFTACAEFGSFAFVHPVLRKLPRREHAQVEKGLVATFGRVMPFLMTGSAVLAVARAVQLTGTGIGTGIGTAVLAWAGAAVWAFGLVTTVLVNVGINFATANLDTAELPDDWESTRRRWELFQGVRSWAFLVSFSLICLTVSLEVSSNRP